eukprot:c20529_g1_i1 orf=356-1153(-)
MPSALRVSNTLGVKVPPTTYDQIRYMKGVPLDFDPGAGMVYSNLGYNILGRVVEKVTGMKYADYVQINIFRPSGIPGMVLGHSRLEELEPNESHYYGINGHDTLIESIFPGEGYVPSSYGLSDYSHTDSFGGWAGSAADIVRFVVHVDGLREPAILHPSMVYAMLHAPMPVMRPTIGLPYFDKPQGLQWFVDLDEKGQVQSFSHPGGAPGAHSFCLRVVGENITIAYVMNTQPSFLAMVLDMAGGRLTGVASGIKNWPAHDLFGA